VLLPGGILVVTVPALMALWSDWDVALHHHRRYTRNELRQLLARGPFDLIHCNYINVAALPAVWLVRRFRKMRRQTGDTMGGRAEDSIPPEPLNRILRWQFVWLACQRKVRFPAGVGLLAVLRKRGEARA
jgi:hypothetical protein